MKLSELLTEARDYPYKGIPVQIVQRDPDLENKAKAVNKKKGSVTILGDGIEGQALGFKTRPNSITKMVYVGQWKDMDTAYINFVALALQHQDNPFFPRISNVKFLKHPQSNEERSWANYWLVIQMEKLHPMIGKLKDAAEANLQRLGIDPSQMNPKAWKAADEELPGDFWDDDFDAESMYDAKLARTFGDQKARTKIAKQSKNPQFQEALNLLEPLWKKYGSDMKNDNIMLRLTPHGPQPVLIDPIFPI